MSLKPTGRLIAEALGISPGRVSQLKREGLDVSSVAAAESWYRRRVDVVRSYGQKQAALLRRPAVPSPEPPPTAADPLERVAALAVRAERLLEVGRFGELEDELREALVDVHPDQWHLVELPPAAWARLTEDVRASVREFEAEGDGIALCDTSPDHSDRGESAENPPKSPGKRAAANPDGAEIDTGDLAAFWYAVAAGLVRATANNNEELQ